MNEQSEARTVVLRGLVALTMPVAEAAAALAGFGWDSSELVVLTRADAARVLRRFLDGRLGADEVARWADVLEGRDDVGRENGFGDALNEFLFEMATPEVAGPLTEAVANRWLGLLRLTGKRSEEKPVRDSVGAHRPALRPPTTSAGSG